MMLKAAIAVLATSSSLFAQAPVAELLKGVGTVAAPGSPGVVLSLKETISPVVLGGLDKRAVGPVIVAGTWGKGRIVACGHSGYIDKDNLTPSDTAALMERLALWCATGSTANAGPGRPRAALVLDGDMGPWLSARGFSVAKMEGGAGKVTEALLGGATLVVIGGRDLDDAEKKLLSRFVREGGGLLAAQTGWGWQQIKGGPDMRTNSLNRLLAEAGVAWTDEIIDKTAKDDKGFDAAKRASGPITLDKAFDTLLQSQAGSPAGGKEEGKARSASLAQASAIVSRGVRVLPESDTSVLPKLRALLEAHASELAPSEEAPLDGKRPLLRTLLAVQVDEMKKLPPEKVKAHRSAASFPGAVAPDAERVERVVEVDTRVPRWHGFGLYAPAGEVVRVSVPKGLKGLSVRIGCHTDQLWHLPSWKRVPEISREWKLQEGENRVASAFGGLLYIDVDKANTAAEPVKITVSGCVEAPFFVLGKTSVDDWRKAIRNAPGPWAELVMSSVVITVPSSAVRGLDDPMELCTVWQKVLDDAADFGAVPRKRPSPERYVPDVQISAGYMHSGYPIMTHMDAVGDMSQSAKLKAGSWGLFHELGHNHQKGEWTFEGTGEVTNNLWSLYLMETIAGRKGGDAGLGHEAMDNQAKRREKALRHVQTGADFNRWKSDPFLALEMYFEMREAFGWEPFTKVFAEYQALKPSERPRTDLEKHDQWMVRMSRAEGVRRNLGPFFEKWGVPTSQAARDSIKDLPVWMPEGLGD